MVDLATIEWSEPEEPRLDRQRRLDTISSGRHPETGELLVWSDLSSLKLAVESLLATDVLAGRDYRVPYLLAKMEASYLHEANPMLPWEAYRLARDFELPIPDWVFRCLDKGSDNLLSLLQDVEHGGKVAREAEAVGKALGFGLSGRGRGSAFEKRKLAARDDDIHDRMQHLVDSGEKTYIAYSIAAQDFGLSRSAVAASWAKTKPENTEDA